MSGILYQSHEKAFVPDAARFVLLVVIAGTLAELLKHMHKRETFDVLVKPIDRRKMLMNRSRDRPFDYRIPWMDKRETWHLIIDRFIFTLLRFR